MAESKQSIAQPQKATSCWQGFQITAQPYLQRCKNTNIRHPILRVKHVQVKTKTQPKPTSKTLIKAYDGIYSLQTPAQQFLSHTNWATGCVVEVGNKNLFGF